MRYVEGMKLEPPTEFGFEVDFEPLKPSPWDMVKDYSFFAKEIHQCVEMLKKRKEDMLIVDTETFLYPQNKPPFEVNVILYVKRRFLKFFYKWELAEWDAKEKKFTEYDDKIVSWCDVRMGTINLGM